MLKLNLNLHHDQNNKQSNNSTAVHQKLSKAFKNNNIVFKTSCSYAFQNQMTQKQNLRHNAQGIMNQSLLHHNNSTFNNSNFQKLNNNANATSNANTKNNRKKTFILPSRFKKTKNKIETNVSIFNKTTDSLSMIKTCTSSFHHRDENSPLPTMKKIQKKVTECSVMKSEFDCMKGGKNGSFRGDFDDAFSRQKNKFIPQTLNGIRNRTHEKWKLKEQQKGSSFLQGNITKTKFYRGFSQQQRDQQFQHICKNFNKISRFTILELRSYFCSLLQLSKGQFSTFKSAFEIMLNLSNVTVRDTIMNECIKDLIKDGITFENFLKTFTEIQDRLKKQAIIDYFEILLQDIDCFEISYEQLLKTFEDRMKRTIAIELVDMLYEKMGKQFAETIEKKQIHHLCYTDEHFCNRFYALNQENMLNNKYENKGN